MKRHRNIVKGLSAAAIAAIIVVLGAGDAHAWPWSKDMVNQPSIKPQEQTRPFPARSVPTTGIATEYADRDATEELENPFAATKDSISKGRTLFRIYCAACHGLSGRGESPVTEKIGATDLTDPDNMEDLTDGWIFGTISFGSALMPPYGRAGDMNGELRGSNDLSVEERWHVVNYVTRQLSLDAALAGPLPEPKEE
ncbi:MAG: c-type cytochrome [Rhodospirillaceae bacterium]|nr:c-type cytochrome [Rhodospirillaceae bacterium]